MLENPNGKENKNLEEENVEKVSEIKDESTYEVSADKVDDILRRTSDSEDETSDNLVALDALDNEEESEQNNKVDNNQNGETSYSTGFLARFTSNLVDQALLLVLTLALFMLGKLVLPLVGFQYNDSSYPTIFFVLYAACNLLYVPIIESTKLKKTLGKALLNVC